MIVAYNALSVRPGIADGAATFSVNVVAHLPAALPDDEVVVLAREGETRFPPAPNLRLVEIRLRANAPSRLTYEWLGLARELRRQRSDVLVSPNESLPLRSPCPVVVVAQNLVYHCARSEFRGATARDRLVSRLQAAYYRRVMPVAYARAAAVAAVSETVVQVLAERARLSREKAHVIYEGSDSVLMPEMPQVDRADRLLVVSALAPYKGLERTIELFARLRAERPELTLALVGSDWRGFRARLEALVDRHGLERAVEFAGSVGVERLVELYASSLALLHLSECESFGLPLVEAMRYGLPVVSSGESALGEVAAGAALALSREPEAAARAVLELLADEATYAELRARGYRRAAELTWRSATQRLAAVVRDAVSRGGG